MQPSRNIVSYDDAIEFMQDYPERYHELNECFRSSVSIDIFYATQSVCIVNKGAYEHWLARDPGCVTADHKNRAEMLDIQMDVAVNLIQGVEDVQYFAHIPPAIISDQMPLPELRRMLGLMVDLLNISPTDPTAIQAIERLICNRKFDSDHMYHVAMMFPHLLHWMHREYSMSLGFITGVIDDKWERYLTVMKGIDRDTQDGLHLQVSLHYLRQHPENYARVPKEYVYSQSHKVLSVSIALATVASRLELYAETPYEVRNVPDRYRDLPIMITFDRKVNGIFSLLFVTNGFPFRRALAMAAYQHSADAYASMPQDLIREMDRESNHSYTLAVLGNDIAMAAHAPIGSPVFDDRQLCIRALAAGDAAPYVRFPARMRAHPDVVAALVFQPMQVVDRRDPAVVFAAVPQDTLLDPSMPAAFMAGLQRQIGALFVRTSAADILMSFRLDRKVWLYREMFSYQPVAFRILHDPIFTALTEPYRAVIIGLQRILRGTHEVVARIMGLAFGNEHLRRIRRAYCMPEATVAVMRQAMGVTTPDVAPGAYRSLVNKGEITLHATAMEHHPDEWFIARHIADVGYPPRVDLCDRKYPCGECHRCTTLRRAGYTLSAVLLE